MKKGVLLAFALTAASAIGLDWKLPVVTAGWEIAAGASEDEEDATLVSSSLRDTVTLRLKEEASPASFSLLVRYSTKDYVMEASDYSYLEAVHEAALRVSPLLKLGASLGGKYEEFGQLDGDGLSKDFFAVKGRLEATLSPARGTQLEAGLGARFDMGEEPAKSRQAWTVNGGFSSRLGQWILSARYRGEFRQPLGGASAVDGTAYNLGSVSLQWDPNK